MNIPHVFECIVAIDLQARDHCLVTLLDGTCVGFPHSKRYKVEKFAEGDKVLVDLSDRVSKGTARIAVFRNGVPMFFTERAGGDWYIRSPVLKTMVPA